MNPSQVTLEHRLAESLRARIELYETSLRTIEQINQAVEKSEDTGLLLNELARQTQLARREEDASRADTDEFQRRRIDAGPALQRLIDRANEVLTQVVTNIDTVVQHAQQHKNALEPRIKVQAQATQMRSAYSSASKLGS